MDKPISEAKQLLKDMPSNNYHWAKKRVTGLPQERGRCEVNAFIKLTSKDDAFFKKADRLQHTPSHGSTP